MVDCSGWRTRPSVSQTCSQSVKQPVSQADSQSSRQSAKQPVSQAVSRSSSQSSSQSVKKSSSQSVSQSVSQSSSQSLSHSVSQAVSQPASQSEIFWPKSGPYARSPVVSRFVRPVLSACSSIHDTSQNGRVVCCDSSLFIPGRVGCRIRRCLSHTPWGGFPRSAASQSRGVLIPNDTFFGKL